MVYEYPIVRAFLENQGGSKDAPLPIQLSLPYHTKLDTLKLIPLNADKYLTDVYNIIDEFAIKATGMVPFTWGSNSMSTDSFEIQLTFGILVGVPIASPEGKLPPHIKEDTSPKALPALSIFDAFEVLNASQLHSNKLIEKLEDASNLIENIDSWRDLKMSLIEFSKFIDKVVQSYKHQLYKHPDIEQLEGIKNKIVKLISKANVEEIKNIFGEKLSYSNIEIVTAALGLNSHIASSLHKIRDGSCNHQTDQYHITDIVCKAVEQNYKPDTPIADILAASGFSTAKASLFAEELENNELSFHQSLSYWVEWYLDFMFEYDIFLTSEYAYFPHNEDQLNEWFSITTARTSNDESTDVENEYQLEVQVYNSVEGLKCVTKDGAAYPPRKIEEGVWYHATDHASAEHIRIDGIQLHEGNKSQDFSHANGFYLTPYVEYAEEWAKRRGGSTKGAIIVFKHKINADKYKGLDLCFESDEKWSQVVKYYRSGEKKGLYNCPKKLVSELKKTDYIEGPMSGDGTKFSHVGWEPTKKKGESNQLCIKSQKLADEFSDKIDAIIFLSTNNNYLQQ